MKNSCATNSEILVPNSLLFGLLLLFLVLLPGGLIVFLGEGSMRLGVLISVFLICITFGFRSNVCVRHVIFAISCSLAIASHFIVSNYLYETADALRFVASLAFLLVVFVTSLIFVRTSFRASNESFDRVIGTIYNFLLLLAFFSIPLIYFEMVRRKSMIFFSEPSHFAIVFAPFYLYKVVRSRSPMKHLIACSVLALVLQSVTLLAVLVLCTFCSVRKYDLRLLAIIGIAIFLVYLNTYNSLAYFTDRIILDPNSTNLSVLVFLSGYERAYLAILDSYGLGVGFQQMGLVGPTGWFQGQLRILGAENLNLLGGGVFAAKIIFEFGLIGVCLVLLYLNGFLSLIHSLKRGKYSSPQELFYSSCFVTFFIVLFVRGAAYFTPSFFLFVCSIVGLSVIRVRNNSEYLSGAN